MRTVVASLALGCLMAFPSVKAGAAYERHGAQSNADTCPCSVVIKKWHRVKSKKAKRSRERRYKAKRSHRPVAKVYAPAPKARAVVVKKFSPPLPRPASGRPVPSHPFAWLASPGDGVDRTDVSPRAWLVSNPILPKPVEPAPVVILPIDIASAVVEKVENTARTIFGYIADLLRPVGNCRGIENVDPLTKQVAMDLAREFGKPARALSCVRPLSYNRKVYGNRCNGGRCKGDGSQHIPDRNGIARALDISIEGVDKYQLAFAARKHPIMKKRGGVGIYKSAMVHIDTRKEYVNWNWSGDLLADGTRKSRKKYKPTRYASAR